MRGYLLSAAKRSQLKHFEGPRVIGYGREIVKLKEFRELALRGSARGAREVATYVAEAEDTNYSNEWRYPVAYGWHYLWFLLQTRSNDKPNMLIASDAKGGMRELAIILGGCSEPELRKIEEDMFDVFMEIMIKGKYSEGAK